MTEKKDYREHQPFDRSPYNKPPTTPFDPDKPVRTRDGRKARIICTDFADDRLSKTIIARIELTGEQPEASFSYHANGRIGTYGDPHPCDLINIPEKRWATLHANGMWYEHESAEEADKDRDPNDVACLEFTVGEGL